MVQASIKLARRSSFIPGTSNTTSLLASGRTNSSGGAAQIPKDVQEIMKRHAERRKAEKNATPGAKEMVTLRAEAVNLIDTEYDALFQHVAQSLASFVHEENFAPEEEFTNADLDALQTRTMQAVADELEPRFDRMAGLAGGLYDKAKGHKKRDYVASLNKYVPDYCDGQHNRFWILVRRHLSPAGSPEEEKFKEELKESGKYIEGGIEDYIELSYYSNLMGLHGRNSSQVPYCGPEDPFCKFITVVNKTHSANSTVMPHGRNSSQHP